MKNGEWISLSFDEGKVAGGWSVGYTGGEDPLVAIVGRDGDKPMFAIMLSFDSARELQRTLKGMLYRDA